MLTRGVLATTHALLGWSTLLSAHKPHTSLGAQPQEKLALLAETEQLHLNLEDEVAYRERATLPPPPLSELQGLKHALKESIAQQEHARHSPALRAPTPRERRVLSRFTSLAGQTPTLAPPQSAAAECNALLDSGSPARAGKASQRLRRLVADASGAASAPADATGGSLHQPA
jgi:hypothetical protein